MEDSKLFERSPLLLRDLDFRLTELSSDSFSLPATSIMSSKIFMDSSRRSCLSLSGEESKRAQEEERMKIEWFFILGRSVKSERAFTDSSACSSQSWLPRDRERLARRTFLSKMWFTKTLILLVSVCLTRGDTFSTSWEDFRVEEISIPLLTFVTDFFLVFFLEIGIFSPGFSFVIHSLNTSALLF